MKRWAFLLLPLWGCPPPTPTPTPLTPPPPPVGCECIVPPSTDTGWREAVVDVPYNEAFIREAREDVGEVCGLAPDGGLARLAEALRVDYICAEGPWADAVLVMRPDGIFEEWHAVQYGTGCWTALSNAYKGAWIHPLAKGCK